MSIFALNLVIGLGLGLAIDYTLFLVTRYREELAAQGPTLGAIATTMRTAGRTVAFSAATVAVALAALTAFPLGFIKSMGIAGAVVAVVAATAALVISPAMFALWGAKLGRKERGRRRGHRPLVPPLARRDAPSRRRRDRHRRGHARPGRPRAAGRVDARRQLGHPDRPELADRGRRRRRRLRRHRRQPDDDRGQHATAPTTPPRSRRTPSRSARCPASSSPAPRSSSTRHLAARRRPPRATRRASAAQQLVEDVRGRSPSTASTRWSPARPRSSSTSRPPSPAGCRWPAGCRRC